MIEVQAAIGAVLDRFPEAIVVSTCGYITRDVLAVRDRESHFYLVGSMGMAAPVGVGLAIAEPKREIVVFDGDGSFVMNLSATAVVAQVRSRLVHIVLDNGMHASTGGQRTVPISDVPAVAVGVGYSSATSVDSLDQLRSADVAESGPTLLHIACDPRAAEVGPRLALTPRQLVSRFRSGLSESAA